VTSIKPVSMKPVSIKPDSIKPDAIRRVAILGGVRIPFCRNNTAYAEVGKADQALLRSVVFIAAALAELTSLTVHFVRGKTIGHHA